MIATPTLLAILAHPDDESLGFGGTLAHYAARGADVRVLTATRGEAGRHGEGAHPGREALGRLREAELREACGVLGVAEVGVAGLPDGGLRGIPLQRALDWLVPEVRRIRPDVVLTFGSDGAYGHPDHIAVGRWALAAASRAAESGGPWGGDPHRTGRLYHLAWPRELWDAYQAAFRTLSVTVDGVERHAVPVPDWAITTRIDATASWERVWRAVSRHRTQMSIYRALEELGPDRHRVLWGRQSFCRILDLVGLDADPETDLFPGLSGSGTATRSPGTTSTTRTRSPRP